MPHVMFFVTLISLAINEMSSFCIMIEIRIVVKAPAKACRWLGAKIL